MRKSILKPIILILSLVLIVSAGVACTKPKQEQSPLLITDVGPITLEDKPFQLTAKGGSGSGAVTYALTEGVAATVSANGLVTPVKLGDIKIVATKAGDDTYQSVASSPLIITVSVRADIKFSDQIIEGDDFDKIRGPKDEDLFDNSLFYRNDLKINAPDPSFIHVTEGEWAGWFYVYFTGAATRGYSAKRSRDLIHWEDVRDVFVADKDQSWATGTFWAPEVIYYQSPSEKKAGVSGKYYMFFSALHGRNNAEYGRSNYSVGMAYADSPAGPFKQFVGTNADGRVMGLDDVYLETIKFPSDLQAHSKPLIDAHCFVDDDGEIYLYFSLDSQHGDPVDCSIWGMRMKDMFTPDYSTVKQLTEFDRKTVDGTEPIGERDFNNEGPFVIKHNGKYYLTFSHAFYFNPEYTVSQAIADDPLGDFVKVDHDKGGQVLTILGNNEEDPYDFMAGTAHHSFIEIGDELFIVYHAFRNRSNISNGRHMAMDRVSFLSNGEEEIMYANGPSYSLQPLPSLLSGYDNIASRATITATNALSKDTSALTDGQYKNHNFDYIEEFTASCDTRITLTFDRPYDVAAVMIYNAFDYQQSFTKIDEILLKTSDPIFKETVDSGYAAIKDLAFNSAFYRYEHPNYDDIVNMRPGGSAVAVIDDLSVTEIVITIKKSSWYMQTSSSLAISDIVVLGK